MLQVVFQVTLVVVELWWGNQASAKIGERRLRRKTNESEAKAVDTCELLDEEDIPSHGTVGCIVFVNGVCASGTSSGGNWCGAV